MTQRLRDPWTRSVTLSAPGWGLLAIAWGACGGGASRTEDAAVEAPGGDVVVDATPGETIAGEGPRDGRVTWPPPTGLIHCDDALFVDAPLAWVEVEVTPDQGMDGIRRAIDGSDRSRPTRIRVAPGVYEGTCLFVEDHLRSEAAPLVLRGADGEADAGRVQIDCVDGNGQAFAFMHSSWIGIEGFTFGPATGHYGDSGIHVSGRPYRPDDRASFGLWEPSHHVVIRNNVMRNLNRGADGDGNPDHYESGCCDGAKANQTEFVWYIGNVISRTARHGIDNVGVHHAAACGNVFYDLVGEGQGIEAKGGSWDILFEGNRMDRVFHRGVVLGGEGTNSNFMWPVDAPAEAYGVVAMNNVIVNAADGGLGFYGCSHCAAVHNTIWFSPGFDLTETRDFMRSYASILEGGSYDEWGEATRVGEVLANEDVVIANNFFGAADGTVTCPFDASLEGTVRFDLRNNRFYNGGDALPECGEGLASVAGYPDRGATLDVDPALVDGGRFPADAPDLRPLPSSPLAGAAQSVGPAPTRDFAGRPRPSPAAIGALEP